MRPQKFAAPKSDEGVDYRQLLCAILYNELIYLRYAAGHDQDEQVCRGCNKPRPKWGRCPNPACNRRSYFLERLVEVVTFFESEFAFRLCQDTDIDYDAYIRKSKQLFDRMPDDRQKLALVGAAEWWNDNDWEVIA